MTRNALLGLCTLLLLAGCTASNALPTATPTALPVVTLSGAIAHPTPPIGRERDTPPSALMTATAAITPSVVLTPTPTPAETPGAAALVLLPTITPAPAVGGSLPANFRAAGAFASTTRFADGTTQRQEGSFTITQVQAANAYGLDEAYELTAAGDGAAAESVAVFQIGDYVAVRYADDWMVLDRAGGSQLVKAVQPIVELARRVPQVRGQAQDLGLETVDGVTARRYRLGDPAAVARLLTPPVFQPSGRVAALQLDGWIDETTGALVRYTFAMEVTGAQVLDAKLNIVSADQQVTWSFELTETGAGITLAWPEDAPAPGVLEAPGFAPGEFPIPPNTEVVSTYMGLPELASTASVDEVSAFYHDQLMVLGWSVEGNPGLLRCAKNGVTFQLLITADEATGGSKITLLPAE
ncbi:MAG: hypothetical protein IT329_05650 [Caldilineaceae bacterium]|nr:hypothetical protein [Caldilineaceae bacterium]